MPNQMFEVASPFDEDNIAETAFEAQITESLDAESLEINARRALAEHAENLRLARAL